MHNATAGRLKATFDDLGPLSLKTLRPAQAYVVRWEVGDWPITVPTALEPVTKASSAVSATA